MSHEIRFATFNVLNLALPETRFYPNQEPYSIARYDAKISWLAQQLDRLDADVIGLQEVFSQAALTDVLARTRNYRDAHQIGFDPVVDTAPLTPSVALISRLPVLGAPILHRALPRQLSVALPQSATPMTQFTRPILQVELGLPQQRKMQVFVAHLKSKRPDWLAAEAEADPDQLGIATLRSLIRRGAEALGLRYLVTDLMAREAVPVVVLADFNDVADSVSTQMVMGADMPGNDPFDMRLFDSVRIQSGGLSPQQVGYTHLHDGIFETIDHVLVSQQFNRASRHSIGEVVEVHYLNDHVSERPQAASDHGQVLVRLRLFDPVDPLATALQAAR